MLERLFLVVGFVRGGQTSPLICLIASLTGVSLLRHVVLGAMVGC